MAKKTGNLAAMKQRAAKAAAVAAAPAGQATATAAAAAAPKKPFNPVQFAREVRVEGRKITWTSRRETWITSVMVFIMVMIAAVFFFVVDWALSGGVGLLLKAANAG